jgi:hypothetical protein
MIIAEPSSETPIQLSIILADEVPSNGLLVLSGLPDAVSLSAGRSIGVGEWAVPLTERSNLTLRVPAGLSSDNLIYISLLAGWNGNRPLTGQARTRLVIVPGSVSKKPVEVPFHVATAESDQHHSQVSAVAAASPQTSVRYVPAGSPVAGGEETSPEVHKVEPDEQTRPNEIASRAERYLGRDRLVLSEKESVHHAQQAKHQTRRNRVVRRNGFEISTIFRKLLWW